MKNRRNGTWNTHPNDFLAVEKHEINFGTRQRDIRNEKNEKFTKSTRRILYEDSANSE